VFLKANALRRERPVRFKVRSILKDVPCASFGRLTYLCLCSINNVPCYVIVKSWSGFFPRSDCLHMLLCFSMVTETICK